MNLYQAIAHAVNLPGYHSHENKWHAIKCPLHNDSSPSAAINFGEGMFTCQAGCGSMPLPALAKKLNLEYGDTENVVDLDWMYDLYEIKEIPIKKQVKELTEFLQERKLDFSTIERWHGEYISDKEYKDHLYGFLVFQVGKGYTARKILPSALGERFRNSKNTKTLFGKENLKLFESQEQVILLEGITDFLTMHQLGYKNIVCSLGAKLSKEQAYLLRNKIVYIIYDRDYAGHTGAKEAAELLKTYDCTPIIIELPDNDTEKNDINMMYVKDERELKLFLKQQLTRHSTYDKDYVNSIRTTKKVSKLWSTGLPSLDNVFNGGFGNGVYAFSGEEKIGKSTLVSTLVHSFVENGARVFEASYELSKVQIWSRLAARYSRHSWQDLELDFSLASEDWCSELDKLSNNFKVEVGPTMDDIFAARNSFDIFIIDYIQRMPYAKAGMDDRTGITHNNRALSEMMAKYNKTIVMISSMPRSAYGTNTTAMYKGTGDIEYTVQGGIRMAKMGSNTISFRVMQNTRGESDKTIFAEVDWRKQILTELSDIEYFQRMQTTDGK